MYLRLSNDSIRYNHYYLLLNNFCLLCAMFKRSRKFKKNVFNMPISDINELINMKRDDVAIGNKFIAD